MHSLFVRGDFLQLRRVEHVVLIFVEVEEVYSLPGKIQDILTFGHIFIYYDLERVRLNLCQKPGIDLRC